jgi:Protein of unknown function (DUF2891)
MSMQAPALAPATVPSLDRARALWLTAVPLGCLDELQPKPANRTYFWDATFRPVENYERTRAFYGCSDYHSAVSATWTLVKLLKLFPDLDVAPIVREKLTDHFGRSNFDGDVAYFREAGAFERPYGYAWLLKLQAELLTWKDPDAPAWANNAAPLAKLFSERLVEYLKDLDRPNAAGSWQNTALALNLALDYTDAVVDAPLRTAIEAAAQKFYAKDPECATAGEPAAGDIVSPCLEEAALMSRVLAPDAFARWLDGFLPAQDSPRFLPLTIAPLSAPALRARPAPGVAGGPRAAVAGLAFARAEAFGRIAAALPSPDTRVAAFRRFALLHGRQALDGLADPAALDAPWLGARVVSYLLSINEPAGGTR